VTARWIAIAGLAVFVTVACVVAVVNAAYFATVAAKIAQALP